MNLNNKKFVTIENESGLSSDETIFHYSQIGNTIIGKYKGGAIFTQERPFFPGTIQDAVMSDTWEKWNKYNVSSVAAQH